ncbi:glycine/D-amino acid oxidase-like deaminating enzyme [Palleronia aestuarii]|uniref:Glycine/D-amino acid oxidase-like deaminating enzyme n=1 Tax=Palleronia aestuarii TaxID=568105 RepID=A0A2W7NAA3_9RHOB|nr:FAD-binding oxidoreductase [Palleronia aestuarii]PZX17008.1 glycine/D-amino acid oxidase-like deaminating enzyme [Palleronia aestuarii]
MRVVICGGGAIGAACAYYLTRRGTEVVVVERTGVASAASGKSGGFLALDWCDGSALEPLARRSFALHADLPGETGRDWGYRRMTTYAGVSGMKMRGRADLPWLSEAVALQGRLGTEATTAQVHPALFTQGLMAAAIDGGARLVEGEVTGLTQDAAGHVSGVRVDGEEIAADRVVLAMGPWSIRAGGWLDLPAIHAVKGHSLVYDVQDVPAEALFLEHREGDGGSASPEIFPRADGTVYACAISSEAALPDDPAATGPDPGAIERLEAMCLAISARLTPDRVIARQACFRPIAADGLPVIGLVEGWPGVHVATGHSVWGILNAPATGEAVADVISGGMSRHVDLSPFDPARLPPMRRGPARAMRRLGREGAEVERR